MLLFRADSFYTLFSKYVDVFIDETQIQMISLLWHISKCEDIQDIVFSFFLMQETLKIILDGQHWFLFGHQDLLINLLLKLPSPPSGRYNLPYNLLVGRKASWQKWLSINGLQTSKKLLIIKILSSNEKLY